MTRRGQSLYAFVNMVHLVHTVTKSSFLYSELEVTDTANQKAINNPVCTEGSQCEITSLRGEQKPEKVHVKGVFNMNRSGMHKAYNMLHDLFSVCHPRCFVCTVKFGLKGSSVVAVCLSFLSHYTAWKCELQRKMYYTGEKKCSI